MVRIGRYSWESLGNIINGKIIDKYFIKALIVDNCKAILTALSLILSVLGLQPLSFAEENQRNLCGPDPLAETLPPYTGALQGNSPLQFTADSAESSPSEAVLKGNVEVEWGDQRLKASQLVLDRNKNVGFVNKGVVFSDPELAIRGKKAEWNFDAKTGWFESVDYYYPSQNAQGSAQQVKTDRPNRTSRFENATYSTCTRGNEFWKLRARRLDVDEKRGRASARHMTFAFKDVPVLYFPYFSYPITDKRETGFLLPRIGYDNINGYDLTVPFYWNIAPEQDMTISPRILTKRGVMLGGEYRYLQPKHQGQARAEFLPDDRVFGSNRSAFYVEHRANPLSKLYTDVLFQEVSDDEYLNDFSNTLDLLNPTYLERHLNASYFGENWSLLGRFQNYQTLDPAIFDEDEPYSRLPQVLFTGSWRQGYNKPIYELRGEVVNFDRDTGVSANRLDIMPAVSLPLRWPAGYVSPRLSYRLTNYNLRDTTPGENSSPSRDAPMFSLDTGLFFERPLAWPNAKTKGGLLTLEPRLFYLYVPFRDQSDIPIFDSAQFDPSYTGFFLENRFTGADRLGDANQLTTALTSRVLDPQGRERGRINVGQVQFFEDRRVTLNEQTAIATEEARTSSSSRLIGEARAFLGSGVFLSGSMQWDPVQRSTIRRAVNLDYNPGGGRLLKGAYRFTRDTLEELDFAMVWPIGHRWRTVGRWNYSLLTNRNMDALAGIEYRDCCWALRFLGRQQRINPRDDETKNLFYVELELRGLGGIGTTSIENLLEGVISGYPRASY